MDFCPSVFIFEFEQVFFNLACINLFKVNNRNTMTIFKINNKHNIAFNTLFWCLH